MSQSKNSRGLGNVSTSQERIGSSQSSTNPNPGPLLELYALSDDPARKIFLDELILFQQEKGEPFTRCPTVSRQPVDLFELYLTVKEMGGFAETINGKMWKEIGGLIGIGTSLSATYTLRHNYIQYLLPYECKFDRGGIDPSTLARSLESDYRRRPNGIETGIERVGVEDVNLRNKKMKTDFSENQAFVDFSCPPSLQSIALVSVATQLWSEYGKENYLKQLFSQTPTFLSHEIPPLCSNHYSKLEAEVKTKLTKIDMPDSLKIKISNVVRPIGLQICKSESAIDSPYKNFSGETKIYWTMEGTVDCVALVEEHINNELRNNINVDFMQLFNLACIYCSEKCISDLWTKISPENKSLLSRATLFYEVHILSYWVAVQKNELPSLHLHFQKHFIYNVNASIHQNMITLSLHTGNVVAFKYFWHKLTELEKNEEKWLVDVLGTLKSFKHKRFLNYNVYADILCFLFGHLNDQSKQKYIFQAHSKDILECLFYSWPSQRFFLPTITAMFDYLPADTYIKLMLNISKEIKEGGTACQLFKDVWYLSPLKLKKLFLEHLRLWEERTVVELLNVGDINFVCTMLNDASTEETKQVLFRIAPCLLYSDNVTLVDELLSKTLSSDEDLRSFRESVVLIHANKLCRNYLLLQHRDQVVENFLNWAFHSLYELGNVKKSSSMFFRPMRTYISLVLWGNYEHIKQFLGWYFQTEDEINKFKKSLLQKDNYYMLEVLLDKLSEHGIGGWVLFEKFLNYCLYSHEEIIELKNVTLKFVESFIWQNRFEFSTFLLDWCLDSACKVNAFKHELLFSQKVISKLFDFAVHEPYNGIHLKIILKWFSPFTNNIISKLKSTFSPLLVDSAYCKMEHIKALFFSLLDTLVVKEE